MAAALRGIAIVLLLPLAGCVEAPDAEPRPTEPMAGTHLVDLKRCDFRYADGTPVDCEKSGGVVAEAAHPDGWACVDEGGAAGDDFYFRVWTDFQGSFGVGFDVGLDASIVGEAVLSVDGVEKEDIDFMSAQSGFVRYATRVEGTATATVDLSGWNATGSPSVLATRHLAAHITRPGDPPFVVLRFGLADDRYYVPGLYGTQDLRGADFHAEIGYWNKEFETQISGQISAASGTLRCAS